jgi:hypothetical protein
MTADFFFGTGLIFAAIVLIASAIATVIGATQIFQRYVSTGRAKAQDDDFIKMVRDDELLYYRRGRGFESLISGLVLDLVVAAVVSITWLVTVPVIVISLIAVYLRMRKVAKENFVNALKGKRGHRGEFIEE